MSILKGSGEERDQIKTLRMENITMISYMFYDLTKSKYAFK